MNDPQKESEWRNTLNCWKNSGLSGMRWCRENELVYCQFTYWKLKLIGRDDEKQKTLSKSDFHKLPEDNGNFSGIMIEYSGVIIRLTEDFNPITLKKCMSALKTDVC